MSKKTLTDRQQRLANMNLVSDHMRKLPSINGVTGVNKPDAQSDLEAIEGVEAQNGNVNGGMAAGSVASVGNNYSRHGSNANAGVVLESGATAQNGNTLAGVNGASQLTENGVSFFGFSWNVGHTAGSVAKRVRGRGVVLTDSEKRDTNSVQVDSVMRNEDRKFRYEQKLLGERFKLDEGNRLLFQYRQELENARMDILRFHEAIQYTKLELLRLAKDKKVVEEEYKLNYADLAQARATIEKTRLTCETTVLELRERVQREYELTRSASEELESLRRAEQEMLARDMRDSELVTQLYNLQLRNQVLEEWFNEARGNLPKNVVSVGLLEASQPITTFPIESKPPIPAKASADLIQNSRVSTSSGTVEPTQVLNNLVLPQSPNGSNSVSNVLPQLTATPTIEAGVAASCGSQKVTLPILNVGNFHTSANVAPSPRPSLTALLSPMIRANAQSLRSPKLGNMTSFSLAATSPPPKITPNSGIIEPVVLAANAESLQLTKSNEHTQTSEIAKTLTFDVVSDILDKIRQHSERSDALQLHLRAVCERCTESEDLLRMRDLHIDNLNQQVQLLSKTLEQKVSELVDKEQRLHEEVSKSSVAAFELSRLMDEKVQLETELHGEVAKNHELIYEVVPSCQKRAEEAENSLRLLQHEKQVLVSGIRQLQQKLDTVLASNIELNHSHTAISKQYESTAARQRGLEMVISILQSKVPELEVGSFNLDGQSSHAIENEVADELCNLIELRVRLQKARVREIELLKEVETMRRNSVRDAVDEKMHVEHAKISDAKLDICATVGTSTHSIALRTISTSTRAERADSKSKKASLDTVSDDESSKGSDDEVYRGRGRYKRKSATEKSVVDSLKSVLGKSKSRKSDAKDSGDPVEAPPTKVKKVDGRTLRFKKERERKEQERKKLEATTKEAEKEDDALPSAVNPPKKRGRKKASSLPPPEREDSESSSPLTDKKAKRNRQSEIVPLISPTSVHPHSNARRQTTDFVMVDPIEVRGSTVEAPDETVLSYPLHSSSFHPSSFALPNVFGRKYYVSCLDDARAIKAGDFFIVTQNKSPLVIRVIYLYEIGDQKMIRGRLFFRNDQTGKPQSNVGRKELFQVNREGDFLLADVTRSCEVFFPSSSIDLKTAETQFVSGRDQYFCRQSFNVNTNEFDFLRGSRRST